MKCPARARVLQGMWLHVRHRSRKPELAQGVGVVAQDRGQDRSGDSKIIPLMSCPAALGKEGLLSDLASTLNCVLPLVGLYTDPTVTKKSGSAR